MCAPRSEKKPLEPKSKSVAAVSFLARSLSPPPMGIFWADCHLHCHRRPRKPPGPPCQIVAFLVFPRSLPWGMAFIWNCSQYLPGSNPQGHPTRLVGPSLQKIARSLSTQVKLRTVALASGGPGSAKNDPQSAKVNRKWQNSDSCKATFIALVEILGKKIINNSHLVRVYSPRT